MRTMTLLQILHREIDVSSPDIYLIRDDEIALYVGRSLWPKTYVDAMKGKIVISQLYEQVNMQKSGRKCKTLARAKQYRLPHPTEGWQKRGGTTMYPPSSLWKHLFCRFAAGSQAPPLI